MRLGRCLRYCLAGTILGVGLVVAASTLDFSMRTAAPPTDRPDRPLAMTSSLTLIDSSPTLRAQPEVPWGAFYMPVEIAAEHSITGIITDEKLDQIGEILAAARAGNVKVMVTLGSVGECDYYTSDTTIDYEQLLSDKKIALFVLIYRAGGYEQLASYVNDGTLAAIRVFDEVHYAGHCEGDKGIPYELSWCDGGRVLNGFPIGTDEEPGLADLLHELKKRVPENLPLGSTSQPSYMGHVAERINMLRERENLPPLRANSILAYTGSGSYPDDDNVPPIQQKIDCDAVGFANAELLYLLGNLSCNRNPDNYTWWRDYIEGCQAQHLDFYASWSWKSGEAGNFQTRLADLLDHGVSNGDDTITLATVQQACSRANAWSDQAPVP